MLVTGHYNYLIHLLNHIFMFYHGDYICMLLQGSEILAGVETDYKTICKFLTSVSTLTFQ